jgi:beta-phosphoglucomutase
VQNRVPPGTCYSHAVPQSLDEHLAFIFDMDGVLVNSMPLHTAAWQHYLAGLGIEVDDLETRMHGKRNPELVMDLISADLPESELIRHGSEKEKLWREMALEAGVGSLVVHGLMPFLEQFPNVPKAIGSNAEPENIHFVLQEFKLEAHFPVVVDGFQVARPKPYPDVYLRAAELLGRKPGNCIVFEDSPTGLEAGRAAGMRLVGVETTPTTFERIDLHIRDFTDPTLSQWLLNQRAFA